MAELIEYETERLCLRQWQAGDFNSFATLNADPKVMEYFPEPLSSQASTDMAEKIRALIQRRGWGFWAVEVKGAESFIGFCGLHIPTATLPFSPCVEIGWRLSSAHWGKGYATEAARGALNLAVGQHQQPLIDPAQEGTVKAMVYDRYGSPDVLQLKEMEKPIPKANEVLIKIHATTVTSGDWRARSLNVPVGFGLIIRLVFGISRPRQPILGIELAGEIEAVGKHVSKFKVGDHVFAMSGAGMGCYAEYKCMPQNGAMALKPPNLTYHEAAALSFGGTTALDFLRRGKLRAGESVLVNGASGGVGTAVVQLAKHFGAEVTGVCSSENVALVRSLGANHVIDYTAEDFTQRGETYDIIVDTVGTAPYSRSKGSLKERGRLLQVLAGLPDMLKIPWVSMTSTKKVIAGPAAERAADLMFLAELARAGTFKPIVDRRYRFEQMAEAHRYVDTGRKKGNVVITLGDDE
jgi:NADPH:quinone reductase-like Zn-dependent oxidoreductase